MHQREGADHQLSACAAVFTRLQRWNVRVDLVVVLCGMKHPCRCLMTRSSLQSQACFINWRMSDAHRLQASPVASFRTFLFFPLCKGTEWVQRAGRELRLRAKEEAWPHCLSESSGKRPPLPFVVYNAWRKPQYEKAGSWHCQTIRSLLGALCVHSTSGSEGSGAAINLT